MWNHQEPFSLQFHHYPNLQPTCLQKCQVLRDFAWVKNPKKLPSLNKYNMLKCRKIHESWFFLIGFIDRVESDSWEWPASHSLEPLFQEFIFQNLAGSFWEFIFSPSPILKSLSKSLRIWHLLLLETGRLQFGKWWNWRLNGSWWFHT